jgi:hypothetical protein
VFWVPIEKIVWDQKGSIVLSDKEKNFFVADNAGGFSCICEKCFDVQTIVG